MFPRYFQQWIDEIEAWQDAVAEWRKFPAATRGPQPRNEGGAPVKKQTPSVLYDAMIAPLTPYAIRGAIWYQGKVNARVGEEYAELLPTLIRSWRDAWGEPDLPFYFVRLSNFDTGDAEGWAAIRQAMLEAWQAMSHTGMAVTSGVGSDRRIHPKQKRVVAERLARFALRDT